MSSGEGFRASLQRISGVTVIITAKLYIVGFALFVLPLDPTADIGAACKIDFLTQHRGMLHLAKALG
jgi:hypothetical protein